MNKENLKKARKKMGFTQKEIADRIGVGISTYKNYECGIREPNNEKIVMLAKELNTTTDYLLENSKIKNISSNAKIVQEKINISLKELEIVKAYRAHENMQAAIDRLLEIEED